MNRPPDREAVDRDDALLDDLARSAGTVPDGDPVIALLSNWRSDLGRPALSPVRAAPARHARPSAHRGRRAAVAGIVLGVTLASAGGMAAAAAQAEPGSPLWAITRVLDRDRASSLEARQAVTTALRDAQREASSGHPAAARQTLHQAFQEVRTVRSADGAGTLRARLDALQAQLAGPPFGDAPASTLPAAPAGDKDHDRRFGRPSASPTPTGQDSPEPNESAASAVPSPSPSQPFGPSPSSQEPSGR